MSFIWPGMLLLLGLLPLFGFLYWRLLKRRRRFASNNGGFGLPTTAARDPGIRRHIPALLFFTGLAILIVAMARPQMKVSLPKEEGIVVLSFDVSNSMAAEDLKPNRMEVAKQAARQFVADQPTGVQIGVVSFSDNGFSIQPPTSDQETTLATINRLVPKKGTSVAHGILASLELISTTMGQEKDPSSDVTPTPLPEGDFIPAAIVLFTDGENNEPPDPIAAAQESVNRGVRVYTVGIGTTGGAVLNIEGFQVHSMLDEGLLRQIAQLGNGEYYSADATQDLKTVYQNLTPEWVIKPEEMEITSILAGASLAVLLLGAALSMLWFNRIP